MKANTLRAKRWFAGANLAVFDDGKTTISSSVENLAAVLALGDVTYSWTADPDADDEFLVISVDGGPWTLHSASPVLSPVVVTDPDAGSYRARLYSFIDGEYRYSNQVQIEV